MILLPTVLGYLARCAAVARQVGRGRIGTAAPGGVARLGPPIERVAADLRRINRQRHEPAP